VGLQRGPIQNMDFQKIDKFEVTGKLGQGSFGVVYKGRDPYLKRDVAIKVCTAGDAALRQRFFREAEIAGRLEHRNIVSVFALGFEAGVPFLVQEFLEGEDLRQALERGAPMSGVSRLDILLQVAEGLAYAHEQGVIHRDVKPANVRLAADGRVKVIDFGIAKLASDESQLTQKGVTMGTASYLPPEQVRGGETDHRADIFSFGVLAYELFTGERPFRGKTISALVYQILYKPPLPMTQLWADCPRELSELIGKCLEKQPEARFPSLREVISRLAAIRDAGIAGRLKALGQVLAPKKKDLDTTVSSDVLSQSMISRTAKEVVSHEAASELPTLEAPPRLPASELPTMKSSTPPSGSPGLSPDELPTLESPRKGGGEPLATRRVPLMAAGAGAFGADPEAPTAHMPSAAATQRMAAPPVSPADALPPAGADPVVEFDDLATSAHEISRLVAEGNLSGAMEQLEETMNRQRAPAPPPPPPPPPLPVAPAYPPPAARPPGPPTSATVDEWQPTTRIEVDPRLRGGPGGFPPPGLAAPPQMTPPPPLPELAIPPAPPLPAAAPPATRPAPARPAGGSTKLPLLLAAGGLLLLLLAAAGAFFLLRGRQAEAPPPPAAANLPEPEPAPVGSTQLAVQARPWGRVTEIVDATGKTVSVPAQSATPLLIPVAGAGTFTVTVTRDSGENGQCSATVAEGALSPCLVVFTDAGATANELFKESGWWK
jgi:serine/threonine protein kinase